jgi:Ca2+-binding RTX toxin-like protein
MVLEQSYRVMCRSSRACYAAPVACKAVGGFACPLPATGKGEARVRRTVLLVAVVAACLVMASGVALAATKIGGPGEDALVGTNNPDLLDGRGGSDAIYGKGGDDCPNNNGFFFLIGGTGNDAIHGGAGNDCLYGGGDPRGPARAFFERGEDDLYGGDGNDFMNGGQGADNIAGGDGNDLLIDGATKGESSVDTLSGGKGRDRLDVDNVPAAKDVVDCGGGVDLIDADRKDVFSDCERRGTVGDEGE